VKILHIGDERYHKKYLQPNICDTRGSRKVNRFCSPNGINKYSKY